MATENKVKTVEQVNHLINNLTPNEDLRQELWICYLENGGVDTLASHLQKIQLEYSDEHNIKYFLQSLISAPPSDIFFLTLDRFSEFERSIIFFLMLDFDVERISAIKGISEVRIRQSIANIRYNTVWEEQYGIKNKINR